MIARCFDLSCPARFGCRRAARPDDIGPSQPEYVTVFDPQRDRDSLMCDYYWPLRQRSLMDQVAEERDHIGDT
jgi:hypothetical protein